MNKPNALNSGASSTVQAVQNDGDGDGAQAPTTDSHAQAYENSRPGTVGNVPGAHKAPSGTRVEAGMMSTSKTSTEAGVPDTKAKSS